MGWTKWIAGLVGFISYGPLGALAGYALGSLVDHLMADGSQGEGPTATDTIDASPQQGQRNGFLFSLMVLLSYVIQADGRIMHSEMEYARRFLRTSFGEEAEREGDQILRRLFQLSQTKTPQEWKEQIRSCCVQLTYELPEEQRLQLLAILIGVAKADGHVADEEVSALRELAAWMAIGAQMVDQLANLGGNSLEAAYKLLGIAPTATDEEVRKAYRQMALKCHPDRVQALGDDVRQQAEETFKQINQAKEQIYKARGMK